RRLDIVERARNVPDRVEQWVGEPDREQPTLARERLNAREDRASEARATNGDRRSAGDDAEPGLGVGDRTDVRRDAHRGLAVELREAVRHRALLVDGLSEQRAHPTARARVEMTRKRLGV